MTDIYSIGSGELEIYDTQNFKAANILSTQLGSLEYLPLFGIDLKYFLDEGYKFQNDSFKSYLVQVLANEGINVASVIDTIENLYNQYTFNLSTEETTTGLIAR